MLLREGAKAYESLTLHGKVDLWASGLLVNTDPNLFGV
jgi:hypothetical protein